MMNFNVFVSDSIDFNDHHIIEPKIIHAKHKRAIDNTLEKVSVIFRENHHCSHPK